MSSLGGFLDRVISGLNRAGVPHMLAGSVAAASHGLSRQTQDVDLVIDPTVDTLEDLCRELENDGFYVPVDFARVAFANRDQFNAIDTSSRWKVDFIVKKDREFSTTEFARREAVRILGVDLFVATAEDSVLSKLEWAAASGSERQIEDVARILQSRGQDLDFEYLMAWAARLDVEAELQRARSL